MSEYWCSQQSPKCELCQEWRLGEKKICYNILKEKVFSEIFDYTNRVSDIASSDKYHENPWKIQEAVKWFCQYCTIQYDHNLVTVENDQILLTFLDS